MRRGQQVCSKRNWSQDTCWYILAGCPLPTFICGENHWGLKSAQIVGETLLLVTKCGKYHHVWWLYPHVCWSHPNLFCINTNTCLLYIYIYMYTYVVSPHTPPCWWPGHIPPSMCYTYMLASCHLFTAYMPIQHIKFIYNILQPITAIQYLLAAMRPCTS